MWIGIGLFAVVWIVLATLFFPYSFFSVYKSVSVQTELPILQDYKMKLYEFKKVDEENEGWDLLKDKRVDRVKFNTETILKTFEMDMMTTSRAKISKRDLNEMFDNVRSLRKTLLYINFNEELNYESKKYLDAALRWCLAAEDEIVRLKSSPYYTRFQLIDEIEVIQNDVRMSFDMYRQFYHAYYWYEGE